MARTLAPVRVSGHSRQRQWQAPPCQTPRRTSPGPQGLPGLPGPDALGLHLGLEAGPVQGHALVLDHLLGEVHGEAVGVVELEGVAAGELGLPLGLVGVQELGENLQPAVDGFGKVLLLGADDLGDVVLLLPQVLVLALVLVDDGVDDLVEEGLVDPQELAVAGRPAEQPPQDVAPALVEGSTPSQIMKVAERMWSVMIRRDTSLAWLSRSGRR